MSTGQALGGVVGGAIGAVVGGPTGAIYGAQIGIMAGGLLDPPKGPTIEGPRLSDLSVQTSTYGQFLPRTHGTIAIFGNVFWLENNQLKEVVRKKKSGGKGGGSSSTVKTYTYFATFSVGLCEGPIAGVRRIWVGPDLVYDAGSDDLETIISSNQASAKFTIYTGTDTQQPDPRIQAEMGVANCPAFRGVAYIVVKDLELTNYGNSVAGAQVKVEIVNSLSPDSTRKLLDETILTGDAGAGAYISGSIIDQDDGGALCVDGVKSGMSSFTISSSGESRLSSVIGPVNAYSISSSFSSDDADFAVWLGPLISGKPLLTRGGTITAGDFNQATGKVVKSNGSFYYFESLSATVKKCIFVGSGEPIISYPILSSINHCISNGFAYCLSPSRNAIYKYNVEDFSLVSSSPVDGSLFSGLTDLNLCYANNDVLYIALESATNERVIAVDANTGVTSLFGIFELRPGTNSMGCIRISGDLYQRIYYGSTSGISANSAVYRVFQRLYKSSEEVQLSDIVSAESVRSSLILPADIDTTGLTDSVTGFKVTATGSIRNAIEPLRGAWPFDVVQSGYIIKATSRGSSSVVTIPIGELAIDTQLTESREMDSQLPQNVTVKYIDRDRDYDSNEQRAQRDNTEAVNSLVLELPVVLSATQSAQVADKLIRIYALEKSDFSFTLPAPYRYLEPGDVVTIAATDADYILRLVSVNQTADGRLECSGRPSSASTYTSIAPGDGGQQGSVTIPLAGATVGLLIDCPVIDEGLQDSPGFAVGMNGYSAGWPGGVLYRTADNGQTWDDLQALTGRTTAGFAVGVLAASAGNLIQRGGSLTVSLIGGTLESVTEAQMLNGANIAAYGVNGRWEIIRFQNATLNLDGTYTLDTFWRGDKGSEWATGLHVANDYFVLMTDPDLAFVGMPSDSIGQPRDYRSVTAGADIDSAASASFTYDAVNLETLSGVHPHGSRSAGDLTVTWQRRTRVGGAWRDYVDASLGEASQAYEVDIMDGSTVKRTLAATSPSVLYTSAMQVTDFGSPQASVAVNIYQLSAVVGRGYKLEATL